MTYWFYDVLEHTKKEFSSLSEAELAFETMKQNFISEEGYRFTAVKEVVNGNNTVWTTANLENDPEECVYQVFNHFTGVYEPVSNKTQALELIAELKQRFLADMPFKIVDASQPIVDRVVAATGGDS